MAIGSELEAKIRKQGQGDRTTQYQTLGGIKGRRDTKHRLAVMKLPDNFQGKSVLDIGCNLGAMCIVAAEKNAGRVVGIDAHDRTIEIAKEYAQCAGFKNIEYYVANIDKGLACLKNTVGDHPFDYVFVLSVMNNVDKKCLVEVIKYFCKDTLYLEGHSKQKRGHISRFISDKLSFQDIEFLGYTKDKYTRANFKAHTNKQLSHECQK